MAQSQDEYNAQVNVAKAKVFTAQEALGSAQAAYNAALATGVSLDLEVSQAQQSLQAAQNAYDQSLIPDSSWVRPTVEVQVEETITITTQVPITQIVTETTIVPRQVTTVVPSGLVAKVYNMYGYNSRPPLPTENKLVATQIVNNINFQWGGGQVLNSGLYEDVTVNFTGTIHIPQTGTYTFYAPADDGTMLFIDGRQISDDWFDKGGGGTMVQTSLTQGPHSITLWYYENGGGANVWLYWITPDGTFDIIPASAFGEQTVVSTVYEEVTTTTEVTTYVDQTTSTVTTHIETIPDESAIQPMIKDASLVANILSAQALLDSLLARRSQNSGIIEVTSKDVVIKQQELNVAQQELEAIPPFREPTPTPSQTKSPSPKPTEDVVDKTPTPEPSTTPEDKSESELRVEEAVAEIAVLSEIAPDQMSDKQIDQLIEAANQVFETAEQGSPVYEQALEALAVAAVADDPQLPTELTAIPGAEAVLETFNALGNVGADMAPAVREEAEKTVIASVIATGAAVQATVAAATTAAAVTTSSSGSSSGGGGGASGGSSGGGTNRKVK